MNKSLIQHHQQGIDLIKTDIRKIELEIHCEPLCSTIDQRSLIKHNEGLILELENKINKLK